MIYSDVHPGRQTRSRLVVWGWIDRLACEVARGMWLRTQDGAVVGIVAALVPTPSTSTISHLLSGHVPPTEGYRLVPLDSVDRLEGETVWLCLSPQQLMTLPLYQPDY